MNHYQLIEIAHHLGYTSVSNAGICKGFSAMWDQAVICGDLAAGNQDPKRSNFLRRLNILKDYADSPDLLKKKIDEVKKLEKKGRKLDQKQQDLLEIPAFFEGIALYLKPGIGSELFGGTTLIQENEEEISSYIQSDKLEKLGGLKRAFQTNDQYTPTKLTNYLNALSHELKNKPNVAIDFTANNHTVAVRVLGPDQFQLVDTNYLEKMDKCYTSKELAKELNTTFFNDSWLDWFIEPKPLIMSTSVFTNASNPLSLEKLRATGSVNELAKDKFNNSLLLIAAQHNDVSTLKRIDFNTIDPYTRSLVLARAVFCKSNDATNYLLGISGMEVNKYEFSAIFGAIQHKNYELAQKISKHPSFYSNVRNFEGNLLHYIARTKNPTEETNTYAQKLIDLKVIDLNEKNQLGCTPLNEACYAGNLQLVELFLTNGANLDEVDLENGTVLYAAAVSGNANLVQFLLDKGLDCNALTTNNKTPLHYAILSGNKEVVKTLVAAGANCNIRSNEGFSPLDLACIHKLHELLPIVLAKATLSRKQLEPDSALMQAITHCESFVQNEFLKQALQTYIAERQNSTDYLSFLNLDNNKANKIAAAQALLDTLNGKPANLKSHKSSLEDGLLSSLYDLYNKNQKISPPEKYHSYGTMMTGLKISIPIKISDGEPEENIQHLPLNTKLEELNDSDNLTRSSSSPSPLKKTPF